MSKLRIPAGILAKTTVEEFSIERSFRRGDLKDMDNTVGVTFESISDEAMDELVSVATEMDAKKFLRVLNATRRAAKEDLWKVPSFEAFMPMLEAYLREKLVDGWIWQTGRDGRRIPYAITNIDNVDHGRTSEKPVVRLVGHFWGLTDSDIMSTPLRMRMNYWMFHPGDVSNRHIKDILEARGLCVGDDQTRLDWERSMDRFDRLCVDGFARQFRATGPALAIHGAGYRTDMSTIIGHRVICDTSPDMIKDYPETCESAALGSQKAPMEIPVPRHNLMRFFDLSLHRDAIISTDLVDDYVYDHSLRDKLILPASHADMLDVLTTDIDALTDDIIEGKTAGNIILTKGPAGTGKTLTAEVYAELMERPLYRVHAGTLGTSANAISTNLTEVFTRCKRWDCVLLIDEADVFVMRRGDDIERNAVTAEFLRALEYFPGMIFMTTNRPDDIDEAIISRCAAVISYHEPSPADALRIWKSQAAGFGADIPGAQLEEFAGLFPKATGRDIKHLLRQSLRYAGKRTDDGCVTADIIRKVAMFRGVDMS